MNLKNMTLDQFVTAVLRDMKLLYQFPYEEIIGHIAVLKRTEPENVEKIEGMEECVKYLKRHIELANAIKSEQVIKRHLSLKQGHDDHKANLDDLEKMFGNRLPGKGNN